MTSIPSVELGVYPDDCDAFGHVNPAAMLRLFERARWDVLISGPGTDVFTRNGCWPAVRKATLDFRAEAFPGDRLRFDLALTHHGHSSFTVRETAHRTHDEALVAEGEFVIVCIGEDHRPVAIPAELSRFFGHRPSTLRGVTQYVAVRGLATALDTQGEGLPVVFVHGFPLDRTIWRYVVNTLTGYRRIAPDLRGFGLTDAPLDGYSMGAYAEDLAKLLDVLKVREAVVCALSMGGYVTFELLRRHPERVRALILADTRAGPDDAERREARDAMIAKVTRNGAGSIADDLIPKLLTPTSIATLPGLVNRLREMINKQTADGLAGALAAMRDRPDSTSLLPSIAVPTLVLAGAEDGIVPVAAQRAMAGQIPDGRLAVIPAAGHLAPAEQPVNTGRLIREFLEALP